MALYPDRTSAIPLVYHRQRLLSTSRLSEPSQRGVFALQEGFEILTMYICGVLLCCSLLFVVHACSCLLGDCVERLQKLRLGSCSSRDSSQSCGSVRARGRSCGVRAEAPQSSSVSRTASSSYALSSATTGIAGPLSDTIGTCRSASLEVLLRQLLEEPSPRSESGGDGLDWVPPTTRLHGVRHLAIVMDGNRRYGKQQLAALPAFAGGDCGASLGNEPSQLTPHDAGASTSMLEIDAFCERVVFGRCSGESRTPQHSAGKQWYERSWQVVDEQYGRLVSLLRCTSLDGHRRGGEKLNDVLLDCIRLNIEMVTVYAFSTENWGRPRHEVNVLMSLFYFFFERIRKVAAENGMFIRFISTEPQRLPPKILALMEIIEEETRQYRPRRLVANVCVSYSGRTELVAACERVLQRRAAPRQRALGGPLGEPTHDTEYRVTEAELHQEMLRSITQHRHEAEDADVLQAHGGVDPQVLLRTSGEQRLSNFLLYECAYTELFFISKTWPEVTRSDLVDAVLSYERREKRFGR